MSNPQTGSRSSGRITVALIGFVLLAGLLYLGRPQSGVQEIPTEQPKNESTSSGDRNGAEDASPSETQEVLLRNDPGSGTQLAPPPPDGNLRAEALTDESLIPYPLLAAGIMIIYAIIAALLVGEPREAATVIENPKSLPQAPSSADRATLIEALIEIGDLVPSPALKERARMMLERVGVEAIEPMPGDVFDPRNQRAADAVPTPDRSLHDTISSTERVGYRDGEAVLRSPEVLVYTFRKGG